MLTRYNQHRTLINYNALLAKLNNTAIICIDLAVLDIIRKLVRERGLWSVSYVLENYESGYTRPTDAQLEAVFEAIAGFLDDTGGDIVNVCQELLEAFTDMAASLQDIADRDCCPGGVAGTGGGGSGGAGTSAPPASNFEDDGENYPDGFVDRADYLDYKCHVANVIRESISIDAGYLEAAGIVSLTGTGLALSLLTPVPGVDLLVFAGFLLALFLQGALTAAAEDIHSNLGGANGDELVCALYDAEMLFDAQEAMSSWADKYLSLTGNALFDYFINNAALNRLFERNAIAISTSVSNPTDCNCTSETEWEVETGTGEIRTDGEEFTITAVQSGANYDILINAVAGQCDVDDCLTVVSWAPGGGEGQGWLGVGNWEWNTGDCPNVVRTVNATFPDVNTYQSMQYAATRNISFTMTFIITPGVCP